MRHLIIQPVVVHLLSDGSFGEQRNTSPSQLVQSQAQTATSEDKTICKLMQSSLYADTEEFRSPPAEPDVLDVVMRRVVATGRCYHHSIKTEPLTLGEEKVAKLGWRVEEDGVQTPAIIVDDDIARFFILPAMQPWYVDYKSRQVGPLTFEGSFGLAQRFLAGPKLMPKVAASMAKKMATRSLSGSFTAPHAVRFETGTVVPPTPCLRLTMRTTVIKDTINGDNFNRIHHLALLHFDYDGTIIDPDSNPPDLLRKQIDNLVISTPRDYAAETAFKERLIKGAALSPASILPPDVPKGRLSYIFPKGFNQRTQWLDFLHHQVPKLRHDGWTVDVDDRFAEQFQAIEADSGDKAWQGDLKEIEGGAWWFSLDLGIMVEGQRVALLPLLVQAVRNLPEPSTSGIDSLAHGDKLYVDLPDGRALALPFKRVRNILMTLVELYDQPLNRDGSLTVPLDLATALSRIDTATKMRWLGGAKLKALIKRLKAFQGLVPIAPPRGLQATLRTYQREGLNWLQFLRDYGLGGILADDMGLGKTIQALAHILTEKNAGRLDRPCLVVCPTSLIPNWEDEAKKFTPKLKVLSLHGKTRAARFKDIEKANLVLTTYPLLTRDTKILLTVDWHIVVLDEAQAIKNPSSQVTQLACELKARHRLCLTGTPIENHLGEVWSHFAFLMPGMLGSHKNFTKLFRIPIEKHKDAERQILLARRLKPFILRRNKSDVAKELPPKTEIVHYVEFESAQRDLYETLRLTMHEKVQQAVQDKGFNRSRIVILDALMKLRQTCCDPRLVKLPGAKKVRQSAKLESLMEMLPELIEEGRRILLFSQFTSMLDLIKPELEKTNISFVEIRGDTVDRKTPVTRFQSGTVPLFLISLKAGGTGLNLTAADTVIHYDPWWNPAVENQATDRTHRIGQSKSVFVYKLIAKGTVEERIIELQNRKRGLAMAIMEERPEAIAAFEANDLDYLFREAT